MKKYRYILLFLAIILLHSGCTTANSVGNSAKLTASEENNLAAAARNALLKIPKLSNTDRKFIMKTRPIFRVRYEGYKKGKYSVKWENPNGRTVQVLGKGDMLDFASSFNKISISLIKVDNPGR